MFSEPLTRKEQAVMQTINDTRKRLAAAWTSNSGLAALSAVELQPGKTYEQMTCELIAKAARNFRNTNAFKNMYQEWMRELFNSSGQSPSDVNGCHTTHESWLYLIVQYYKEVLETKLVQLGFLEDKRRDHNNNKKVSKTIKCIKKDKTAKTDTALTSKKRKRREDEEDFDDDEDFHEDVIHAMVDEAKNHITPELCCSPLFAQCLAILPEFIQVYRLALSIVSGMYVTPGNSVVESRRSSSAMRVLKDKDWLYSILVVYLGAMDLHSQKQQQQQLRGNGGGNNTVNNAILQLSAEEVRLTSSMAAATDIIQMSFSNNWDAIDALQFIVLEYCSKCTRDMFPRTYLRGLLTTTTTGGGGGDGEAVVHIIPNEPMSLTYDELLAIPAIHHLLRSGPQFRQQLTRVGGQDVATLNASRAITLLHMYCWHGTDAPSFRTECKATFMYEILVAALRPLFMQLFALHAPQQLPGGAASYQPQQQQQQQRAPPPPRMEATKVGGGVSASGANNPVLDSMTQAQRDAEKLLGEVAALAATELNFLNTTAIKTWSKLQVGPQPRQEYLVGHMCLCAAMATVLEELMVTALRGLTLPREKWAVTRTDPSSEVSDNAIYPFFGFLMRTESIYDMITNTSSPSNTNKNKNNNTADPSAAVLNECKHMYGVAVEKALQRVYPKNAATSLVASVINAIDGYQYMRIATDGVGGGGGAVNARRPPPQPLPPPPQQQQPSRPAAPPSRYVMRSEAELHSVLRLTANIEEREFFLCKYKEALFLRLMYRPSSSLSDAAIDANKNSLERLACEYLEVCLGDSEEMRAMKKLYMGFRTDSYVNPGKEDVKLAVTTVDWRIIPSDYVGYLEMTTFKKRGMNHPLGLKVVAAKGKGRRSAAASSAVAAAAALTASEPLPSDRLPFPPDLWESMSGFQSSYQSQHKGKSVRWRSVDACMVTFTLEFPQDQGRATSITASVFIQQLFLAIAQYKQTGVSYEVLAIRAGNQWAADKMRMLLVGPLRDGLLVETQSSGRQGGVALNYAYTRPAGTRGEYKYVPRPPSITYNVEEMSDAKRDQISTAIIQIMKSAHELDLQSLFTQVGDKLRLRFPLSRKMFKKSLEHLIDKEHVERFSDSQMIRYKS